VAQYRNEALSALLVDHSHAASAKDVDAVLKARDAIYSMFANVAQGAEAQSGTHEAWTYEQVVQLCEIDGVDLPIEYVEWVAEKMTRAANDVLQSISEMSPAGLTEREQFIWNLGHAAALEKPASGNQEPVGLVLTNDKGEKYGALLDSNIEERTRLYAAPPAQTATTDAARECLADVVSHYRALYAGLAFQLNEATVSENSDDMTYWKHEIEALERMYEQAERALTAAQSASASEGK
jgi:hypothetical protein